MIGSGTLGKGCLLELGPLEGNRWLEPGDLVALDAPGSERWRTRSSSAPVQVNAVSLGAPRVDPPT